MGIVTLQQAGAGIVVAASITVAYLTLRELRDG
jgi:hypothetical protein